MWYILPLLITLVLSGVTGLAQTAEERALRQIKRDSRVFENIVEQVLRESFNNPFAIAAVPRAAFLKDYGLNVTFQIKINRGTIRGPWGEINNPWTKENATKEEQISLIRQSMIQALADYGNTVKHLENQHRITICAHIEDLNELDKSKSRTVLLLSASRADIRQHATTKLTFEEFKNRIEILEY